MVGGYKKNCFLSCPLLFFSTLLPGKYLCAYTLPLNRACCGTCNNIEAVSEYFFSFL